MARKNLVMAWTLIMAAVVGSGTLAEEPSGDWVGIWAGRFHIILRIKKAESGYQASLQNLDDSRTATLADKVEIADQHIALSFAKIGSYDAQWDAAKKAWVGTWTDEGQSPLEFVRIDREAIKAITPKRPQEEAIDTGPLPYRREAVRFQNLTAKVTLAGTFSKPLGKGQFPAVLLIAASGPMTRDEEGAAHQVFVVLADHLNRRGLAVLRYDKRGVGDSTGDFARARFADLASDARSAVAYLKTRHDVDARHIGVLGHSEGATIAPEIAVRDKSVGFVVLMAGSGLRGDQLLIERFALAAADAGASPEQLRKLRLFYKDLFSIISSATTREDAEKNAKPLLDQAVAEDLMPSAQAEGLLGFITSDPIREILTIDPLPVLRQVHVPVLAVVGSLDHTVVPQPYLQAIRPALMNNRDATVQELPQLNHMFQTAITGSPMEFFKIEETISPMALKVVGDWIVDQVKSP